jgi:hypothetical protein
MKFLFLIALFLPFALVAQQVSSAHRVFPKVDKVAEFEKAIAAHAQKFHSTGKVRWRIFQIMSGPGYGGYQITEGPVSWDDLEARGDISTEHTADWNKNVAPFLNDRGTHTYSTYEENLSTIALTDYSDWIQITRLNYKPGYAADVRATIEKMKKAWIETKSTVAVYASSSSGEPAFALVTRYKQGLKERNTGFRPPFRDVYEKLNGRDSWNDFNNMLKTAIESSSTELLKFRADLSAK